MNAIQEITKLANEIQGDSTFDHVLLTLKELLVERNRNYGDSNLLKAGLIGLVVRMNDKLGRLNNILKKFSSNEIENDELEIIIDALYDIAGYAVNALRLIKEDRMTKYGDFWE